MSSKLGISKDGISAAQQIKDSYRNNAPICVPGDDNRILLPEYLINTDLDLSVFEDPLPLAMMATRDPESPMALAAATRMSPKALGQDLVAGVYALVGEKSRHPLVKRSVELIRENDFNPKAIAFVRTRTSQFIVETRRQYATALKAILKDLLDGVMAPSDFVTQFIQLTEAGNLRSDVRQKLVTSLLLSETVRPGIKFLMLEHFESFPMPTRQGIIEAVANAPDSRHIDVLKEELRWIVSHTRQKRMAEKELLTKKAKAG
ncbi:MAG: hypothetical protein HQL36_05745 [Alphaproteobacteria bacterium]|nr:hypothetical protein [Alphaproteobacteria bacterium]MBF0250401.1 hypothetical protein [Alphaproteobacteria bacterium]